MKWQLAGRAIDLDRPRLMGIVNVTPDSFSDGGLHLDPLDAIAHGRQMVAAGADLVDVGGESTRPGAAPVTLEEELDRVLPVVSALAADGIIVSVDTSKPEVASAALSVGAEAINDVNGLGDPEMRRVVAGSGAGVVIMHMQGSPRTMQVEPIYDDVVIDVAAFLSGRVEAAVSDGIDRNSIMVDPGIGFGKTLDHNLKLLKCIDQIAEVAPVLLGVSRKSLFGRLLGIDNPSDRDRASAVALALAVERGVRMFRVHNVATSAEAARLAWAIVRATP